MRKAIITIAGIGLITLLGACSSSTTTNQEISQTSQSEAIPTNEVTTESSGNADDDLTIVDTELEALEAEKDFPAFDENSF